jgi:hypothetical protein
VKTVKFSHVYPKLWGQKTAELLRVCLLASVNPTLREYDTKFLEGQYYELPKGKVIQLIFVGDKGIPFCTIRRFTDDKWEYYTHQIGECFTIEITEAKP